MLRLQTVAALGLALALALPAAAQRSRVHRDRDRGPGLDLARVSVADGDVRVRTRDGDEAQARGGDELRPGDAILTGLRSRAEVELDRGNFVRLGSESEVRILDMGNLAYRVQVVRGVAGLTQLDRFEADLDVVTEQATIRTIKPAVFTVEVREGVQTDVSVRDGRVDVATNRRTERVKKGLVSIRGEGRDAEMRLAKAEPKSDFDDWAKRRDKILDDDPRGGYWPSRVSLGVGYGWGRWGGWGYPYYPYYAFGPGLRTVVVARPIRSLPGGRGGRPGRR